jgi:hypothetical protein
MSKRVQAQITCPSCSFKFDFTLYRSIWGEYPENKELVMSDKINVATCPSCKKTTKLNFPFIYTNAVKFFAVWWEPYYDAQIDKDSEGYTKMLGNENYLATAPRIKNWTDFKETILKFENGTLKANPGKVGNEMNQQMQGLLKSMLNAKSKKKSGCMGVILLLIIFSSSLFLWVKYLL